MLYSIKNLLNKIKISFTLILLLLPLCIYSQHWQALDKGLDKAVRVLYNDSVNNILYIGGYFTKANNLNVNGLVAWDGSNWILLGSGIGGSAAPVAPVTSICKYKNELYACKYSIPSLYKWNGTNWQSIYSNGPVLQLYVHDSILYAAGWFDSIGGVAASKIAKYNGNYWSAIDTTKWLSGAINCVIVFNNELYIGGNMISKDGTMSRLARWDGTKWLPLGEGVKGSIEEVYCFEVFNNELYVGGFFNTTTGPGNSLARWNGNSWSDVGIGLEGYPSVTALKASNNVLYVGGTFSYAGGVPINYLAKWDGNNWCGFGISATETISIRAIEVFKGDLYIGGKITTLGSDTLNHIAKWIGGNYTDTCGNFTDIKELSDEPHINVFPNPASNTLFIQYELKEKDNATISIYSITGQKIFEKTSKSIQNIITESIDISNFSNGIYLIQIKTNYAIFHQKFIKQN
jgi:hypothetical protein